MSASATQESTVYLVDGTALCYRAFYALKLSNSRGLPTGAVYGFYQTLKKITNHYKPCFMAVCFDVSRKTFRQEKFAEYKIQRPPTPDDLLSQIPLVKKMLGLLGVSVLEQAGLEADDIIGQAARQSLKNGAHVVVVSSDKDMFQLLGDQRLKVYNPVTDKEITRESFLAEYGFEPARMADYLGLTGDSSDNIPGAKGIGPAGAARLLAQFSSLDAIFAGLDQVSGRTRTILETQKDMVYLSRDLATLYTGPGGKLPDISLKTPDHSGLYALFTELEFKNALKDIPAPELKVSAVCREVRAGAFKTLKGRPLAVYSGKDKVYFYGPQDPDILCCFALEAADILQDESTPKISCDFKSFMGTARINNRFFDVGLAAYLADSSLADYSLAALSGTFLNKPAAVMSDEAAAFIIWELYEKLAARLKADGLEKLFFEVEMPLQEILFQMQADGVKVEAARLQELIAYVADKSAGVSAEIFKAAGKEFNLNSPAQLAVVLFDELKIPPVKKTKTGYSTAEAVLEALAPKYSIAGLVMEYRYLSKLSGTYLEPLREEIEKSNGLLHACFNQTATATGRLSSSSPNLQSIPVKGELSGKLRRAFVPFAKDGWIMSADYSQVELRILAHLSGDEKLIEAFKSGEDIHAFTASLLFGLSPEEVSDQQRDMAKRVNFGIIYGMSAQGLSRELKIGFNEAQVFIQDYFARYAGVKGYIDAVYRQAKERGFVSTILGRRRYLPDFNSPQFALSEFAHRQAVNAPIQGSSADIIKIAMVDIHRRMLAAGLKARLIMQIHDELVFDLPADELPALKVLVQNSMEGAVALKVPLKVSVEAGRNWGEMQKL